MTQAPRKLANDTLAASCTATGSASAANTLAVLIPVFNNEPGLLRTLASIEHDQPVCDIIIVDDGSRPPLTQALSCGKNTVVVLRQDTNTGITEALNRGLTYIFSRPYDFVARIDAADIAMGGRLQKQLTFLQNNPKCGVVSSFVDFLDEKGRFLTRYRAPLTHQRIMRRMHLNNCIIHSSAMIRISSLRCVGVYSNDYGLAGEDYDLFLRMAKTSDLAVMPEVLTHVEDSHGGISIANRRGQQRARLRLQLAHFDPFLPHSYYGVVRTLIAFCTPRSVVLAYKRWMRAA